MESIQGKRPDIKILCHNFHAEMIRCKLLIMDNPSTALNMALAANVPVLCYWEKEAFPLCHQAEPYFEKFRSQGILFNDGFSAAQQANSLGSDIQVWWKQDAIQSMRKEWLDKFG
ncbi:MAG: hypothetical protein AB7F70_11245 [Candidatus Omnitrophota bacterium]